MADTLSVPPITDQELAQIQRHRALAQAMMQETGDGGAVGSPWQAVNRAVSPLLGALMEKQAQQQYGALSNSAAPEYAQIAQSENPIALAAASKNPLIRAMLPELAQMQISGTMGARNEGLKTSAIGSAKLGYEPQLTAQNEAAKIGPAVETAVQTEKGKFPYAKALALINASKPVALPQGSQLVNPMNGAPIGNAGGAASGPWSKY